MPVFRLGDLLNLTGYVMSLAHPPQLGNVLLSLSEGS
jgi:hypothetical protein